MRLSTRLPVHAVVLFAIVSVGNIAFAEDIAALKKKVEIAFKDVNETSDQLNMEGKKLNDEYDKMYSELPTSENVMETRRLLEEKADEIERNQAENMKLLKGKVQSCIEAFEALRAAGGMDKALSKQFGELCYSMSQIAEQEGDTWGQREYIYKIREAAPVDGEHADIESYATYTVILAEMEMRMQHYGTADTLLKDFDTAIKKSGDSSFPSKLKLIEYTKQLKRQLSSIQDNMKGIDAAFNKDEKPIRDKEDAADDLPKVKLETNKGDITILLYENEAPNTVANFVSLIEAKKYDGLTFHRVIEAFMVQGGCPKGDGTGNPGYRFDDELKPGVYRKHYRGVLSMANSGKNTNGQQFFISTVATSHLDGKHTVFGRVLTGMDIVDSLRKEDKIIKMTVLRKRPGTEYIPKTQPLKK